MKRTFAIKTVRQAVAATAVIWMATTAAVAQNNQQPAGGENEPAAAEQAPQAEQAEQAEQAQQADADQAASESDEAKQQEPVVLKVVEFKKMRVTDFLSAAELAGVVDRRARSAVNWQRVAPATPEQQAMAREQVFTAVKPDSSLLFVRGPESKVTQVVELAKKLDVAPEEMPETLELGNGKQARRIPQEELTGIKDVLGSLGFSTSTSRIGDASFLIYGEDEEDRMKQIEQVIDKLNEERSTKENTQQEAGQENGDGREEPQAAAEENGQAAEEEPAAQPQTESEEQEVQSDE